MTRPIRVCLIQHSTRSDNLGVGALTVSEIAILRRLAAELGRELEIVVMDWTDPRQPYVHGKDVRIVDLDRKAITNPRIYMNEARKADMVIDIAGGDSFTDIYGPKRLKLMFLLKFIAHAMMTPVIMAPQTIGPFDRPRSIRLAKLTMKLSRIVTTRDTMSTKHARDMGVTRPIIEASDVALRLPYDPPVPRAADEPPRVGINVSGLLFRGGYTGKNEFGLKMDYPQLVRQLIQHFQSLGCQVHLVPHVIIQGSRLTREDDYSACAELAAEFPGTICAPAFASPSEAKSYIAGMDFFVGARMHACIAAFSSGVPVVPMAYSRKFAGMFGSIGYDRTVDCTTEDTDAVFGKIAAAYDNRDALKTEVDAAFKRGIEKLGKYESALKAEMAKAGN